MVGEQVDDGGKGVFWVVVVGGGGLLWCGQVTPGLVM